MRRSLGKFSNPTTIGNATRLTLLSSSSLPYSASAGRGGRGRGRGSASDFNNFQYTDSTPGKTESEDSKDESPSPYGQGHGRGKPLSSTPIAPSYSSFVSGMTSTGAGRGRGSTLPQSEKESQPPVPKKPIFFLKEDALDSPPKSPISGGWVRNPEESNLPSSILAVLSGVGRGKPAEPSASGGGGGEVVKEENRHLRARQPERTGPGRGRRTDVAPQRLSHEEARKKAMGILSKGGGGERQEDGERERGGFRGRGTRGRGGRGMQGWRGGRGRGQGRGERRDQDTEEDYGGLYLGDDADGEKLAKRIGAENMNTLVEGFEEMSDNVLPSPMEDAYVDALHTNFMIECEPEYLMEEFGTNPDIDEKPPIPLRDALEKMKPFLMAYEGIQSHEQWEEVMKETMETVPILKELVDYYSGPDRVTAKKQQEELERVAKTLPESAPTSVKRFTDRAVLSLKSNPGWGFDKKCQFMDKLVWEVSQHYK